MSESQLFIGNYPAAALFIHILIPVFRLHVFPGENALFELEIDAVLTQNLRKQMTFDLFNIIKDGITKDKVAFIGWMSMQI